MSELGENPRRSNKLRKYLCHKNCGDSKWSSVAEMTKLPFYLWERDLHYDWW